MDRHGRDLGGSISNNGLHTRLEEIIELLYINNGQFPKGLPSQDQLKSILDHSYNCYDQLQFIILEYSKNSVNYLDPKIIAESTHKIMRVTKYLFTNIRHWIESYSVDILRKIWSQRNHSMDTNNQNKCSTCSHFLEEVVIKQAKQDIFGHLQVRDIFEEELREEKKDIIRPPTPKQSSQYLGSVNYLAKIIKEMEESTRSYQKVVQSIEKEDSQQPTMRCIQELIASLGKRLGERYMSKLKKYIRNVQQQVINSTPSFSIHRQISETFSPSQSKKKATELMIKKLKQEISQLQLQNRVLKEVNNTTKNSLTVLQTRQQIQRTEMDRLNELLNSKPSQKSQKVKQFANSNTNLPQTQSFNRLSESQKHSNRYSRFKVKKVARQSQAYSNATTLDLTYNNTNEQPSFTSNNRDQDQNNRFYSLEEEGQGMISVGCQWQDLYLDQRHAKLKENSMKNSKLVKNSSHNKTVIPAIIEEVEEKTQNGALSNNSNKINDRRSSKAFDLNKKSLQKNNRFSLQQNNKNNLKKNQQTRQKTEVQESFMNEQSYKIQKTSLKVLQSEALKTEDNIQKIDIYKSSKIRELNLSTKLKQGKGSIPSNKQGHRQTKQNTFSKQLKRLISNRLTTTQGSEQAKRRSRKIRNTIFKPEHLEMFGGVSESYAYQKGSRKQTTKLSQMQEDYLSSLREHISNLANFKSSLYDNVIMFLKQPFTFVEKNQLEFKPIKERELSQILNRLLSFHKNRCNNIQCHHLKHFTHLIGFV